MYDPLDPGGAALAGAARQAVARALKRGKLTRLPCAICGGTPGEFYHPDYTRPLQVVSLCHRHLLEERRRVREGRTPLIPAPGRTAMKDCPIELLEALQALRIAARLDRRVGLPSFLWPYSTPQDRALFANLGGQ